MARVGEGATDFRILRTKPVREKCSRSVVATIRVAVLAEDDVLVSMHDLDPPMIAIDAQQRLWRAAAGKLETR